MEQLRIERGELRINFLGEACETTCVGCSVISGDMSIPGGIISENESFILHQDPEIPIVGFLIITAKRHFRFYSKMNEQEAKDLHELLSLTMALVKEENLKHTIIIEERSKHFHVLIFPRLNWMDKYPNSIASIRDIMNDAKKNISNETVTSVIEYTKRLKIIFLSKFSTLN